MDPHVSSHVHAGAARGKTKDDDVVVLAVDVEAAADQAGGHPSGGNDDGGVNYMARAQWLRAAVLGANDGLVSVASLMIGVSAASDAGRTMLVSGLAGLVAGACSMAIGEFVSVYAQYDIEVSQIKRDGHKAKNKKDLPSPTRAALASAVAFAVGALVPLLAGGFVRTRVARVGAVYAATTVGLAGFGASGGYLGGASMARSAFRVLAGGWLAMAVTYGVLWLFVKVFHIQVSSLG
jgi:VIT1/CCC1 family predicted Fe2+/Mn2+ transporter